MGLSPVETFEAIKSLVMSGDIVGNVAESVKLSYIERIDRLAREYERAGPGGAFKAGVEAGKLFVDAASWLAGGAGIAKSGVALTGKIAVKAVAKKGSTLTNAAKAADLPKPAPARSFIRLTEQQRLDKNLELFDNFTGGAGRIKNAQITIDGQVYKANPELSKNAAVFDNVPQRQVMQYFKDLAGVEVLPVSKPMPAALDVYGNPGIRYTVDKGDVTYNLRSGSSSVDTTGAKWTIEISGVRGNKVGDRVMKQRKIEVKFR